MVETRREEWKNQLNCQYRYRSLPRQEQYGCLDWKSNSEVVLMMRRNDQGKETRDACPILGMQWGLLHTNLPWKPHSHQQQDHQSCHWMPCRRYWEICDLHHVQFWWYGIYGPLMNSLASVGGSHWPMIENKHPISFPESWVQTDEHRNCTHRAGVISNMHWQTWIFHWHCEETVSWLWCT